jgi:hypothetical protein
LKKEEGGREMERIDLKKAYEEKVYKVTDERGFPN